MTSRSASVSCSQAKRLAPMCSRRPGWQAPGEHVDLADEIGDERRGRIAVDLHRRADLLDHALVHHDDAVGHRQRLFLVVRDHDRRDAELSLQRADLLAQAHALERVERRQRLVEQQQPRRGGERARQRDALLLAAGKLRRKLGPAARQADELQQFVDALGDLRLGVLAVDQAVGDVVGDAQVREQRIRLEHDAVVALGRRQPRDVALALQDGAGGLRLEPGDDAQQRRLAAARRARGSRRIRRPRAIVRSIWRSAWKVPKLFSMPSSRR